MGLGKNQTGRTPLAGKTGSWTRIVFAALLFLSTLVMAGAGCSESTEMLDDTGKQRRITELYQEDKADYFAGAPEITTEQLMEWLEKQPVILVDVRDAEEQDVSMIPGAVRVQDFKPEEIRDSGVVVVAYCTIGTRSGIFVNKLIKQDIEAYNLAGSILSWTHAGNPLIDSRGETRRLHVYGKKWDLAAEGYETVW